MDINASGMLRRGSVVGYGILGCRAVPLEVVDCKNLVARRLITPAETMKQAFVPEGALRHFHKGVIRPHGL